MSFVDLAWFSGEHGQQVEPQQAPPPARAQATAIEDVNRYASSLNDDVGDL
jgi:hypothetical protein